MTDVMNIVKIAIGGLAMILLALLAVTFGGCKLGASAAVEPPLVQETRVIQPTYQPTYQPAPAVAYQPQLAK